MEIIFMDSGYSLDGLFEFMDYTITKGLVNRNTGVSRKTACAKILSILDDNEKLDIRNLDIKSVFERHANLNKSLTPDSLKIYRIRVEKAITSFLSYKADPTSWKPTNQRRNTTKKTDDEKIPAEPSLHNSGIEKTLTLPFPIREDLTITISNIPRDLKIGEARRLSAFLETLAIDFKPVAH